MNNVLEFKKKAKEWKTEIVQQPAAKVNLVSLDIATLLYNVIQTQRQLMEHIEEMSDMLEHMEYQIDKLTQPAPPKESEDS